MGSQKGPVEWFVAVLFGVWLRSVAGANHDNPPATATYITITVRLIAGNKKTLICSITMIFRCLSNKERK